jgi:hypothetical protein
MMNKTLKSLILLFFLFNIVDLIAQKHDYNWLLGYDSDLNFEGAEAMLLNFNDDPVSVNPIVTSAGFYVSSAMVSNKEGELLLYTDGCKVVNSNDQTVENGDSINIGEVYESQCDDSGVGLSFGYVAGRQGSLFLPAPSSDSLYYLLHKKVIHVFQPAFDVITVGLYYTLIDVAANGGAGRVLAKNIPILEEELVYGEIVATKHANGHDWWISTTSANNKHYSILLTSEGIDTIVTSSYEQAFSGGGQAVFSPDGQYYARYDSDDALSLFRFDRATGELYDEQAFQIYNESLSDGVAFSPNSQLLYVSAHDTIYQYDMTAPDIGASRQTVAVYDGNTEIFQTTFHTAQLAPDCKIYIGTFANVKTLHVIHNPNERGTACGVEQHALDLPYWHDKTIPYFPNYRLGPLVEGEPAEPPCEGEFVVADEEVPLPEGKAFAVFPNPVSHAFTVALDGPLSEEAVFSLYNMAGVQVQSAGLEPGRQALQVEVGGLPAGLYIGVLRTGSGRLLGRRKVVVNRKM